jgi:hypothetical protein
MKMLLSVFAVAGLALSCGDVHQHLHAMMAQDSGPPKSAAAAVAGQWEMSLQSPHGPMTVVLQLKQDGTKITGTCDAGQMGSMALTGTVDGKRVSFTVQAQEDQKFTFSGAVEGNKMSGTSDHDGGEWSATRKSETRI